jgi:hypothetical protein
MPKNDEDPKEDRAATISTFDPWSSTIEDAIKAGESNPQDIGPLSPLSQWFAAQAIKQECELIERGDGFAVLACVRRILTHGLVAPNWLSYAFNKRYDVVLNCLVDSWDDPKSFGRPYLKGRHLNSLRKERILKPQLLVIVLRILQANPQTPIDPALFESAGRRARPPVGKTEAERIYRKAKIEFNAFLNGQFNPAKRRKFAGIKRKPS